MPRKRAEPLTRFWKYVTRGEAESCWPWTGACHRKGYGVFTIGGKQVLVHRFAYEQMVGPIPEGLVIDHLCRNRACVNPQHLEPVTSKVNTLRGEGLSANRARQTHCKNGHPLSGENLLNGQDGHRRCRLCNRARVMRGYYERKGRGGETNVEQK